MSAPAPAVGDAAELFDVEMDQLPGTGLLIAHRQPGGLIHLGQAGHAVPGQDAPHSGACQAQVVGDAVGSPPAVEPQGDDAPLSAPCQPLWAVVGGGRSGPPWAGRPGTGPPTGWRWPARPGSVRPLGARASLLPPPDGQDDGAPQGSAVR